MLLEQFVHRDEIPPKVLRGHLALHVCDPGLNVVHSMEKLLVLPCLLQLLTFVC